MDIFATPSTRLAGKYENCCDARKLKEKFSVDRETRNQRTKQLEVEGRKV